MEMIQYKKDKKEEEEEERTKTVAIRESVKNRLNKIGRIDQSFSDVIEQLIDYWEEGHRDKTSAR